MSRNASNISSVPVPEKQKETDMPFIFIAGIMPRCGSTYLSRLLLQHPDICRPTGHIEFPILNVVPQFRTFHRDFLACRRAGRLNFSEEEFGKAMGDGLIRTMSKKVPVDEKAKYLLKKNPATIGLEHFRLFFPEAKLILLTRDGRDNVNSLLNAAGSKTDGGPQRYYYFAKYTKAWTESAQRIIEYSERQEKNCILIKYEDLHLNTKKTLCEIAKTLNLPHSESWLDEASATNVKGSGFYHKGGQQEEHARDPSWKGVEKTNSFNPIGRWKDSWNRIDHFLFNSIAKKRNEELGYEP